MKTTMRFLSLASLALALAFTFSCSDDGESSPTFACEEKGGSWCWEAYGGDRDDHNEKCDRVDDGSALSGKCPKGFVKECSKGEYKTFYYEDRFKNMNCDDL